MLPVEIGEEAEREAEKAARWYERRRQGLGDRFVIELDTAMDRIRERPETWSLMPHVPSDLGVRRVLLNRFPYFVAYLVLVDRVHVVAVGHQHRRPGYYLRRVRRLL